MRQTDFQPEQLRQKIERLHTAGGRIDLHFLLDLVDEVSGGDGPSEPLARQIGLGLGNLYVYELLALLAEVQRELQQIVERLAGDISYKVYERTRSMQIQLNDETPTGCGLRPRRKGE